jgi:hypothetical protein
VLLGLTRPSSTGGAAHRAQAWERLARRSLPVARTARGRSVPDAAGHGCSTRGPRPGRSTPLPSLPSQPPPEIRGSAKWQLGSLIHMTHRTVLSLVVCLMSIALGGQVLAHDPEPEGCRWEVDVSANSPTVFDIHKDASSHFCSVPAPIAGVPPTQWTMNGASGFCVDDCLIRPAYRRPHLGEGVVTRGESRSRLDKCERSTEPTVGSDEAATTLGGWMPRS